MFVHTVIMVIEPHMKQGRQHKLISTIFLATSVTKKLDHNMVHGRLDACVFPNRQYTEFQQNPAPIFRLQQELRRSPSFPHKPVVGSAVASGSSFAPGCRFRNGSKEPETLPNPQRPPAEKPPALSAAGIAFWKILLPWIPSVKQPGRCPG